MFQNFFEVDRFQLGKPTASCQVLSRVVSVKRFTKWFLSFYRKDCVCLSAFLISAIIEPILTVRCVGSLSNVVGGINFGSYRFCVPLPLTYRWLYSPLLDFGRFFSFLILYTVGRTPWMEDQHVARPLPKHGTV
jgi:hypothetical protein